MPNGFPCVMSLWYTCIDNKLYCATQKTSKIVSYLEKNDSCAFEIAADSPPYKGVRGYGTATIIKELGNDILEILIKKYLGNMDSTLSKFLKSKSDGEVAIEITTHQISSYDYSKRMKDSVK
jgi:nitroimidazol reductase NimA-like FMN-containing flavoprotein (pyridoxamine 5'-phosphate oxidase superfamily)